MNSQQTVQLVLTILGLVAITIVCGAVYVAVIGQTLPGELYLALGGALGAVSGMLSQTNATPAGGQPVQVVNPPEAPVPVDAGEAGHAGEDTLLVVSVVLIAVVAVLFAFGIVPT